MAVKFKKNESLKKNIFVTLILPSSEVEALIDNHITTHEMNNAEPTKALTCKLTDDSVVPPADNEAKTSGAPLPSASNVTPARDSEQLSFSDITSRAGDKYISAVDPKLYIAIPRKIN